MLRAAAVAIDRELTRRSASGTTELVESTTSEATVTSETCELSSAQRESSGSYGDCGWPSVISLLTVLPFSEAMSDRVTTEH